MTANVIQIDRPKAVGRMIPRKNKVIACLEIIVMQAQLGPELDTAAVERAINLIDRIKWKTGTSDGDLRFNIGLRSIRASLPAFDGTNQEKANGLCALISFAAMNLLPLVYESK